MPLLIVLHLISIFIYHFVYEIEFSLISLIVGFFAGIPLTFWLGFLLACLGYIIYYAGFGAVLAIAPFVSIIHTMREDPRVFRRLAVGGMIVLGFFILHFSGATFLYDYIHDSLFGWQDPSKFDEYGQYKPGVIKNQIKHFLLVTMYGFIIFVIYLDFLINGRITLWDDEVDEGE